MNVRKPLLLVAFPYLVLFFTLFLTYESLPDPLATHFNGRGIPDDWSNRVNYLLGMAGLAIFFPTLIVGLCFALRYFPDAVINVPNRSYWLAPERRPQVNKHFFEHSIWFAGLAILFVFGLHLSLLDANSHQPPRLSLSLLAVTAGGFLIGTLAWTLTLVWPYLKKVPPREASAPAASRSQS
jgi:serine/threonine-protein kinase